MLLEVVQKPFGSAFKCLYSELILFQHAASVCMVCFGLSNSAASAVTGILPAFVCLKKLSIFSLCLEFKRSDLVLEQRLLCQHK